MQINPSSKSVDEILELLKNGLSNEPGTATEIGWEAWGEEKQELYANAKTALLDIIRGARIDELEEVKKYFPEYATEHTAKLLLCVNNRIVVLEAALKGDNHD